MTAADYHYEPIATKRANKHIVRRDWSDARAKFTFKLVYGTLQQRSPPEHVATLFAEKTPRNCFIVRDLARWFPQALFILINRDGRDVACSLSAKDWYTVRPTAPRREAGGEMCGPYARAWVPPSEAKAFSRMSDIRRCACVWRHHTEAALEELEDIECSRHLTLQYEALVAAPERTALRIADFLRITCTTARQQLLAACATARPNAIGQYARQLSSEAIKEIESEAGALLTQLGYGLNT